MKTNRTSRFGVLVLLAALTLGFSSCNKEDELPEPIQEGIQKSALILTTVSGDAVHAHGDHFHGLAEGLEGRSIVIEFDEKGIATKNGHLHLEADAVYKVELRAWNYQGKEVQNEFLASKTVADSFKAFLVGGNFKLNTESSTEQGAIFQPREQKYLDGTAVDGKYETTGILSYFTVGHDNQGATKEVTYILRKLNAGLKGKIERTDWNRTDYKSAFAGENILELKFEIHAEHGHGH